jgi:hypothetical protein
MCDVCDVVESWEVTCVTWKNIGRTFGMCDVVESWEVTCVTWKNIGRTFGIHQVNVAPVKA